jgi:hypothetical protein
LGRLPGIKRLRLRELAGVKGVFSTWDPRHETVTEMPATTTGLDGWYAEAIVGIENIFSVLRVDVHRRLTPSAEGMREPWGVRVGLGIEL